jgi:hypothetical protein
MTERIEADTDHGSFDRNAAIHREVRITILIDSAGWDKLRL